MSKAMHEQAFSQLPTVQSCSLFPYSVFTSINMLTCIFRALELDCLKNSHPIEVPVGHPSEIDEIFDDISYNKGASVIRMLHRYIGDDDFRKGMNIYLTRHQVNLCVSYVDKDLPMFWSS